MKRYANIDKLYNSVKDNVGAYWSEGEEVKEECLNEIYNAPTADVVEVVRCKDCKYKMTVNFNGEILIGCSNQSGLVDVCADGYCSYGERREK